MSTREPDEIAKMDWRLNALTWTTAPFTVPETGFVVEAGSAVTQSAFLKHGRDVLSVSIPNATALFLDLSKSLHDSACQSLARTLAMRTPRTGNHLPDADLFACIEATMASIVFACTALEAFVNEKVPDTYVHVVVEERVTRQYDKQQIERALSLDHKIGDVLPAALGMKTPKGGKLWSDYQKLRDLRDRIVHMKTADRFFNGEAGSSIWNSLLTKPLPATYAPAKAMMRHFFASAKDWPRWLTKCPF